MSIETKINKLLTREEIFETQKGRVFDLTYPFSDVFPSLFEKLLDNNIHTYSNLTYPNEIVEDVFNIQGRTLPQRYKAFDESINSTANGRNETNAATSTNAYKLIETAVIFKDDGTTTDLVNVNFNVPSKELSGFQLNNNDRVSIINDYVKLTMDAHRLRQNWLWYDWLLYSSSAVDRVITLSSIEEKDKIIEINNIIKEYHTDTIISPTINGETFDIQFQSNKEQTKFIANSKLINSLKVGVYSAAFNKDETLFDTHETYVYDFSSSIYVKRNGIDTSNLIGLLFIGNNGEQPTMKIISEVESKFTQLKDQRYDRYNTWWLGNYVKNQNGIIIAIFDNTPIKKLPTNNFRVILENKNNKKFIR